MNDTSFTSLMPPPTIRQHSPLKGLSTQSNIVPSTNQGSLDKFEREKSEFGDKNSLDRSIKLYEGASTNQLEAGSSINKTKMVHKLQNDYKDVKI